MMRLQLSIQRHQLPPVHILWNVSPHGGPFQPPPPPPLAVQNGADAVANVNGGSSSAVQVHGSWSAAPPGGRTSNNLGSKTIAQLLGDISEVVPLESADGEGDGWGLEDYIVRVGRAECLHFDFVESVLREGDEVVIQAIDPREKKIRRLGGREQITSDGRHLVDGISFGRPYLRRSADRPTVTIPPRKKARLELEWEPEPQVFTDAQIEDEDEDSEDDGDYVEGGAGDDEDASEDEDMSDGDGVAIDDEDKENVPERQVMLRTEFDNTDEDDEEEVEEEEEPVALVDEVEVLQEEEWHGFDSPQDIQNDVEEGVGIIADMGDGRRRSKRLSSAQGSAGSGLTWIRPDEEGHVTRRERRNKRRIGDTSFESSIKLPAEPVELLEDSGPEEDGDSDDSGSSESTTRLSPPTATQSAEKEQPHRVAIVDEDETSSSGTSSDETTSDEDSDPDSDSESTSDSEESSLSSSSSSSSSSGEESVAEKRPTALKHQSPLASAKTKNADLQTKVTSTSTKFPHQQPEEPLTKPAQAMNAPGKGSSATHRTNRKNRLRKLKKAGKIEPYATLLDFDMYLARTGGDSSEAVDTITESQEEDAEMIDVPFQGAEGATFEAERQRLLSSLAEGGVDVNLLDDTNHEELEGLTETATGGVAGEKMSEPPQKRSKLDISSTRRLLFGSLGVRTPKTKEDEEITRQKLAGHSRTPSAKLKEMQDSSRSTVTTDNTLVNKVLVLDSQNDDEAWKKKIVLMAVECCHDGVELSAPPFPFVQRWDPQQQSSGHKRKRGNGGHASNRQSEERYRHDQEEGEPDVVLNYDEEDEPESSIHRVQTDNGAIRDQLMRDADGLRASSPKSDSNDGYFPPVPPDIEKRPVLEKKNATWASFIAYQELRMDEFTKWEPTYSSYMVAHIDKVVELWKEGKDGNVVADEKDVELHMHVALRDLKKKQRKYDEETGERIYAKFDMPGADEDEEEDDGKRILNLSVLCNPKLVKAGEKYYPPPEKTSQAEDSAMELSAPAQEEPEDLTILPEPSLEPQTERRSSFSVDQEASEWPSSGISIRADDNDPAENLGNETIRNPSPDLGATGEPGENLSAPQADGQVAHTEKIFESSWVTEEASDDESFYNREAVVQETPSASFQENPNVDATELAPELPSSATRADISTLIKDAGFRQSVDSSIAWQADKDAESSSMETAIRVERRTNESFESQDSFETQPTAEESAAAEVVAVDESSLNGDGNGNQDSEGNITDIPSPKLNGFGSSPQRPRVAKSPKGASSAKGTPNGKNKAKGFGTPGYPKLPVQAESGEEIQNGDNSVDHGLDDSNLFGDDEYTFGESTDVVEDSMVVSVNMQDGQEVNAPRHELEEDDSLLRPISLSKDNSATSSKSFGLNETSHDDDELPDLDQTFSSTAPARSFEISPPTTKRSQKKATKASKKAVGENLRQWPFSDDAAPAKSLTPEPKKKKKKLFSSKHADFAASSQDRDLELFRSFGRESTPPLPPVSKSSGESQSQVPKISQIVDLTQMSSDPPSAHSSDDDSDEEERDVPNGAGWIKKEALSQTIRVDTSPKKSRKIRRSEI